MKKKKKSQLVRPAPVQRRFTLVFISAPLAELVIRKESFVSQKSNFMLRSFQCQPSVSNYVFSVHCWKAINLVPRLNLQPYNCTRSDAFSFVSNFFLSLFFFFYVMPESFSHIVCPGWVFSLSPFFFFFFFFFLTSC